MADIYTEKRFTKSMYIDYCILGLSASRNKVSLFN